MFGSFFQGYLLALGMARTAQVKRDARIGEAEAKRDSGIKVKVYHQYGAYEHIGVSDFYIVLYNYAEVDLLSWFKLIFIFVHFCVPVML